MIFYNFTVFFLFYSIDTKTKKNKLLQCFFQMVHGTLVFRQPLFKCAANFLLDLLFYLLKTFYAGRRIKKMLRTTALPSRKKNWKSFFLSCISGCIFSRFVGSKKTRMMLPKNLQKSEQTFQSCFFVMVVFVAFETNCKLIWIWLNWMIEFWSR